MNPYLKKQKKNDGFILSACHSRLTCVTLSLHPYTNCSRRKVSEQYDSVTTDDATDLFTEEDQNHKNGSLRFGHTSLNSVVIFTNLENKAGAHSFREPFFACSCLNQ